MRLQTGAETASKEMVEVAHEALMRELAQAAGLAGGESRLTSLRTAPGREGGGVGLIQSETASRSAPARRQYWRRRSNGQKGQKTPAPGTVQEFLTAALEDIIVVDQETGLMWTRRDNGEDVNWHEANEYARHLRLGGYSDWRLPTIEELEKLYDPKEGWEIQDPKTIPADELVGLEFDEGRLGFRLVFDFARQAQPRPPGLLRLHAEPCVCVVPENDGLFGDWVILKNFCGLVS